MSMILTGTVKTAGVYEVAGKDGTKKPMISFSVADGLANIYPCQMWPDDPQFANLAKVIESYRRHQVQLKVVSYTTRMRTFKTTGKVEPWANFLVSEVTLPAADSQLEATFAGTAKSGNVGRPDGKKPYIWLNACNELGTTFACRMWSDDPQFSEVAAQVDGGVHHRPVQFLVASYSLNERTFKGQTNVQLSLNISDVSFPALARA
ncbi:MAG TPA: hypothetical protein VFV38_11830 [Ktedonobacteraceae bacterium]|nr:hypothetical protein [Ktedonobacteraceae bacterium]